MLGAFLLFMREAAIYSVFFSMPSDSVSRFSAFGAVSRHIHVRPPWSPLRLLLRREEESPNKGMGRLNAWVRE